MGRLRQAGRRARIDAILKEKRLLPSMTVVTGRTPHLRAHLCFRLEGPATPDQLKAVNAALKVLLGSDDVQDPARLMRLAGTVNYPKPDKVARGYVAELVTLHIRKDAPAYPVERLTALADQPSDGSAFKPGPAEPTKSWWHCLRPAASPGDWHVSMLAAIASMIGRGWADGAIRMMCKPYCRDGYSDNDLDALIDGARAKME